MTKNVKFLSRRRSDRFINILLEFFQVVTELNKQEATYKEVKLTHRKIVEKKEEYSLRASEVTENQRKLHRSVLFPITLYCTDPMIRNSDSNPLYFVENYE